MKKSVMVGMSGGVDSSAAAAILIEQGYEVCGATMDLLSDDIKKKDNSAIEDAKKVCDMLGIKHYVLDLKKEFREFVIDYFTREYINGRTPNPCISCNKHLKFGLMYQKAKEMGIDYIATGHYARIIEIDGEYELRIGNDLSKDQSYVLYNLTQELLSHTLMPLGEFTKEEIREKCKNLGLSVANKSESMEICFVEDDDYVSFIQKYTDHVPKSGKIVDTNQNVLGEHKGLINYTIGQRKGIGAYGRPMFVLEINPEKNELVLGEKGMEFSSTLIASDINFISGKVPDKDIRVQAKVRYQAKPADASLTPYGKNKLKVEFSTPQRAVTPGQSVVFYDGDKVLGGGVVCK